MRILGLVGGIGSGKSAVAKLLVKRGAVVLDADRFGHEVLRRTEVKDAIRARFGDSVFQEEGEIDRKKLASRVFEPTENGQKDLMFLNDLTHPKIMEEFRKAIHKLAGDNTRLVVLDAPLLFESEWSVLVAKVLFIDAPESVRRQRCEKRGWTSSEFHEREAAQWPVEKKRQMADYVLNNAGTEAELNRAVDDWLTQELSDFTK